jgi:DNA polymerase V
VQGDLFVVQNKKKEKLLMEMMDNMNFSMRNDVLKFASSGLKRNWKMQQNFNSPRYTTRWHEIYNLEMPVHLKNKISKS